MRLINPGSRVGATSSGWTNTYAEAKKTAERWLQSMHEDDGLTDVDLVPSEECPAKEGRWTFLFKHRITGVYVALVTHGIDDIDAYKKRYVFDPRVYWKGSSCSNPTVEDFAASGYRKLCTFVPV